ncbi:hypothetical protein KY284_032610 [Solanum tuberosum]|nr:hypothetical protein KY284_032610 [Solanum tuberosum]
MDFSDRDAPYPCLEIVENKQHSRAKVLTLKVHPPVIGAFPLLRKTLDTYHHLPEWSSTETKDVTDDFSGNVTTEKVLLLKSSTHRNVVVAVPPRRDEHLSSWLVPSSGFGEVRYTSGYWEWVKDVLARCKETLDNIKTYDAIFASMFTDDHNENVLQDFCENWRPSTNTVSTFVGELSISLWNLRTIGGLPVHGAIDEVSFREWTKFWFRGPRKYVEPSPRTSKNRTKPRMNHGPSGNIDMSFLPRTEEENAPFVELGVKESFRDETYLAAFLVGFAIPILASIYRGLRDISTSSNLGACNTLLPFHYVYGWIGEYFETYFRVTRP